MGYESNLTVEGAKNLIDIKEVEKALMGKFDGIESAVEKMNGQIKESGSVSVEVKNEVDKLAEDYNGLYDRIKEMEQKGVKLHE